jgi:acylphosphatase
MAGHANWPERRDNPAPLPIRLVCVGAFVGMILILEGVALRQASAESKMRQKQAILATVTGDDQQVGFRAMIMKQAIEYNLAGSAKNEANQTVHFTLQGDSDRLDLALAAIRAGTKKSSNIEVSTTQTAVDSGLSTFTIIDWTSTSRDITNRYTLVFTLRADDEVISKSEAKDVWHQILRTTLRGDDLQKLGDDD